MSAIGNLILDIEEAVIASCGGFSNETFSDIAERLGIPVSWVENEYERLNGPSYDDEY